MIKQSMLQTFREKIRESEINIRLFLIVSSCFSYLFLFIMIIIGNMLAIIFNYFIIDNKNYHILYEQIQNYQNYELITILLKFNPNILFLIIVFSIIFFPVSIKEMSLKLIKNLQK